jgi:HlyD family secretion protein
MKAPVTIRTWAACAGCLAALIACNRSGENDAIEAVGTIEVVETDIAPTSPGRVVRVWVNDGDAVRAGDTLVTLANTTLPADIDQLRARVAVAQSQLRDLEAGARPEELRRQEAELRAAEAEAERATKDAERFAALLAGGGISQQEYDRARAAASTAVANRDAIAGSLRLLREGARPARIASARAELASARSALAAGEAIASDLSLIAPVDGRVMARHVETGEVLGAGEPAITVGEMSRPWARVFVGERAVPAISLGQSVTARLDGSGREFTGRVVAIDDRAQFTPRIALTEDERADLMFGVKIEFADSTGMLRPGLPATVSIRRSSDAVARARDP